jgi:hypothetical protein
MGLFLRLVVDTLYWHDFWSASDAGDEPVIRMAGCDFDKRLFSGHADSLSNDNDYDFWTLRRKSCGFFLHKSRLSDPKRLSNLMMAACLAFLNFEECII